MKSVHISRIVHKTHAPDFNVVFLCINQVHNPMLDT